MSKSESARQSLSGEKEERDEEFQFSVQKCEQCGETYFSRRSFCSHFSHSDCEYEKDT